MSRFYYDSRVRTADIRILPEIVLAHPIYGFDSNSLSKFRSNETMKAKCWKQQSLCTAWPSFVFDIYDVDRAINKIKKFLTTLKIGTVYTVYIVFYQKYWNILKLEKYSEGCRVSEIVICSSIHSMWQDENSGFRKPIDVCESILGFPVTISRDIERISDTLDQNFLNILISKIRHEVDSTIISKTLFTSSFHSNICNLSNSLFTSE